MAPEEQKFATPRVAAGVLFRDQEGRVLLVKPTYKDGWDLPGGYVEVGESPKAAAAREVREELGVQWPVGRLLAVDWAPHPNEGDKLLFIFDGSQISPADVPGQPADPEEIQEARLHTLDTLPTLMPDRLARRIQSAAKVLNDAYLENGVTTETGRAAAGTS